MQWMILFTDWARNWTVIPSGPGAVECLKVASCIRTSCSVIDNESSTSCGSGWGELGWWGESWVDGVGVSVDGCLEMVGVWGGGGWILWRWLRKEG